MVPRLGLQSVIVAFPGHAHFLMINEYPAVQGGGHVLFVLIHCMDIASTR